MAKFKPHVSQIATGPIQQGPPPLVQTSTFGIVYKTHSHNLQWDHDPSACVWSRMPFWYVYICGDTYGPYMFLSEIRADLKQLKRRYTHPEPERLRLIPQRQKLVPRREKLIVPRERLRIRLKLMER